MDIPNIEPRLATPTRPGTKNRLIRKGDSGIKFLIEVAVPRMLAPASSTSTDLALRSFPQAGKLQTAMRAPT
jgi:hypothetical protein